MLKNFIRQLSKDIEADPPLEAVRPGVYEYFIEEDLAIVITEIPPDGFMLFCTLGPYPKEREELFFASMMAGNLFGKETIGATLGLDDQGNLMTLSRIVNRRVDYREFKETLEDFFHIITFWRNEAGIGSNRVGI